MPEGSLTMNIQTLQGALSAVTDLLGEPSDGDGTGSGLAGAASLASTPPTKRVGGFAEQLTQQVSGVLEFDATASLSGIPELFTTLEAEAQSSPIQALDGFQQRIAQANSVFSGDFVARIQETLDAVRSISDGVPEDRTAVVGALLDQILGVLGILEGPEAEKIRSWIQSTRELQQVLMPLIEEAQSSSDPSALAVEVIQRSLDSTLDAFGFERIKGLLDFLDGFLDGALPPEMLGEVSTAATSASAAYGEVLAASGAGYVQFRGAVETTAAAMQDLKDRLRPVLGVVRRIDEAKILQPGALDAFLRQQMEDVLAVQVQEVQKIDDPFKALFDRIDAAIEDIDLSFVRTEVLGFFESTRDTIEQVDIASIGDFLEEQLEVVEAAVRDLQQGVTDLFAQIEAFFDSLQQRFRTLTGGVGTFQPDGTFVFNFETDLRRVLNSARLAIGGDPSDPASPSVAGSIQDFQTAIEGFLNQLDSLLDPIAQAVDTAADTAVTGINDFSDYLEGLDIAGLMEQLRQKVDEILDALIPVDFDLVVDPVVAEIEENTEKLRSIDPASLNDLLRQALKVALDVIIQIDFTAAISDPLEEQFETVKAVPERAIEQLQQRYEQAVARLDELKPEQLLVALFSAFDVIDEAVGSVSVGALLGPLDRLHERHLQQPLAQLKPLTLLRPVSEAFQDFTGVFDDISGEAIIAPVDALLDDLKEGVAGFDITGYVDNLLAAVEKVKQDLRDIRPSELLEPLLAELERLEGELDRFKPSVVFQPAAELATPLLQALETVQQQAVTALFEAFQAPLQILDRLEPEVFVQNLRRQLDVLIEALESVDVSTGYNQLKGQYFDLKLAVEGQGDGQKAALVELIDPERHLGELVDAYEALLSTLEGLKENVVLPDLDGLYAELRERLLSMLPPYARELLDPEAFKRIMRLADPTRFLQELDARFDALKEKLIPIRPQDIAAELDETYEAVLAQVDELDIEESLNRVKEIFGRVEGIVGSIRVDFLAADIDDAVSDLRAMVNALDPTRLFEDLDAIHHEVELVVESTVPSQMLSGLEDTVGRVQDLVASVDPRTVFGPPLDEAWQSVEDALQEVDFRIVLSPVVDKLDELEQAFEDSLRRTETAFDQMLGAARGTLSGGASVGVTL
jgi:hypothetical protein